jgi:hypothetical protein
VIVQGTSVGLMCMRFQWWRTPSMRKRARSRGRDCARTMARCYLFAVLRALQRFWSGDYEGATYTLVPRIEAQVRDLILSTHRGIFKLQKTHSPGQFPGLGAMLALLPTEFEIDESRQRFLKVVLTEPAGFNLRNRLAHGAVLFSDIGSAAIAIHVALYLATPTPAAPQSDDLGAEP